MVEAALRQEAGIRLAFASSSGPSEVGYYVQPGIASRGRAERRGFARAAGKAEFVFDDFAAMVRELDRIDEYRCE